MTLYLIYEKDGPYEAPYLIDIFFDREAAEALKETNKLYFIEECENKNFNPEKHCPNCGA